MYFGLLCRVSEYPRSRMRLLSVGADSIGFFVTDIQLFRSARSRRGCMYHDVGDYRMPYVAELARLAYADAPWDRFGCSR